MPSYLTTADWVVAQLRREDWIRRHQLATLLKDRKERMYAQVVKKMSPIELLEGMDTGISASPFTVVVARDIKRSGYKQLTLNMFFKRVPAKPAYKQVTLHRYFKRKA